MEKENKLEIDVEPLEDWEKFHILKVLDRNRDVRKIEERRTTQLAVRLQLSRMSDSEINEMVRVMDLASGSWVNEIATKCSGGDRIAELRRLLIDSIDEDRAVQKQKQAKKLEIEGPSRAGSSSGNSDGTGTNEDRDRNSSNNESIDDGLGSSESEDES